MDEGDYWQAMFSEHVFQLKVYYEGIGYQSERPSTIHKPRLSIDGNMWCALHGDNLQDGVAGFGESPEEAYKDFDRSWNLKLSVREEKDNEPAES